MDAGTFKQAQQRGAGVVLRSMVPNAREVYALLVNNQVEDPESEGLDFKLLFRCVSYYLCMLACAAQAQTQLDHSAQNLMTHLFWLTSDHNLCKQDVP